MEDVTTERAEDPYMTVREGLTTDTGMSSEGAEADLLSRDSDPSEALKAKEPELKMKQDEGIQSTDSEEEAAALPDSATSPSKLLFNDKQMFKNETIKDNS